MRVLGPEFIDITWRVLLPIRLADAADLVAGMLVVGRLISHRRW